MGNAVYSFTKHNTADHLPSNSAEAVSGEFRRIARVALGYHEQWGLFIIQASIFLIEQRLWSLYGVHGYLSPVDFSPHNNGAVRIRPRGNYLFHSQDHKYSVLLSSNNVLKCQLIGSTNICDPISQPMLETERQSTCEVDLFTDEDNECDYDIIVQKNFPPLWQRLYKKNHWLYSVTGGEKILLVCNKNIRDNLIISGVGVSHMRDDCEGFTSSGILTK